MIMGNIASKRRGAPTTPISITPIIQDQSSESPRETPSSFFTLPRELRDQILSYVIEDAQWAPDYRQHAGFGPHSFGIDVNWAYRLYPLILVSRQVQSEVLDTLPQNIVARGMLTMHRYLQLLKSINGLGRVKDVNVYLEYARIELDTTYALMCASTLNLCKDIRMFVTCMGETYPDSGKFLSPEVFIEVMYYDFKKDPMRSVVELVDSTWRDRDPLQSVAG
jgi:hypothetical protein